MTSTDEFRSPQRSSCMTNETLEAGISIAAPAFAVLADPTSHPAIDGTGWVSKALDTAPPGLRSAARGQEADLAPRAPTSHPAGRVRGRAAGCDVAVPGSARACRART